MNQADIMTIFKESMIVAMKLSAPILLASVVIGLIVAIFQAATQIHEQTLTFVPKLIVIALILLLTGSWMITTLIDFTRLLFDQMTLLMIVL